MTAPYPPIKPNPIWFIFALRLVVAELVYLALLYPSLPQQLPMRFDLLGQATGWAEKRAWAWMPGSTLLAVFTPRRRLWFPSSPGWPLPWC